MSPPSDIATLSGCDHTFCFACIQQWSKTENTCPLCKKRFDSITSDTASLKVKARSQRSESAIALESLLHSIGTNPGISQLLMRTFHNTNNHRHNRRPDEEEDSDDEDDDSAFPAFMNVFLRSTITTTTTTHVHHAPPAYFRRTTRSSTAEGRSTEHAIDLCQDDENDDDDDVQVVHVTRHL
jgi:hypothetical protein